jgi:hypothetical protein
LNRSQLVAFKGHGSDNPLSSPQCEILDVVVGKHACLAAPPSETALAGVLTLILANAVPGSAR